MFELDVAARHIRSRRRQTLFSIIAVALAVGVIIVTMSMMSGYTSILIDSTVENQAHITVQPKEGEEYIYLYHGLEKYIHGQEGVEAISSHFQGEAALHHEHDAEGVLLYGINPNDENRVVHRNEDMLAGEFTSLENPGSRIILGYKLAKNLDVGVGDTVTAQIPGVEPADFTITGIFQTGTPVDETLGFTNLGRLQDLYGTGDAVTGIGVRMSDAYAADTMANKIDRETDYDAISWIEQNAEILNLLETSEGMVYLFYIVIFAISGFGIANILIMIVMEKVGEIGMLMAMGTPRRSIMLIFLLEAGILGMTGVIIGCVLGYGASLAIASITIPIPPEMYFGMDHLPVVLKLKNFISAGIFAMVINIIAGLYPARRASKMDPVEAIYSV
ncbi:MAG: ABC transporter permease [Candidatus Methanogaster sp.]|uniref:ABC transporter permease n=1 Tax=Candidatus Methanogaster sp. TaxID=3386292 RepID=A0AC61KZ00_9EURY|nr:MAG: ABC transporter permease [ANME-2 cluster archaeon]